MKRVILIAYGELTTKKGNRNFFVKTLYENLKAKLQGTPCEITKDLSRMYLTFEEKDQDLILDVINHTFGILTYYFAYQMENDVEEIKKRIVDIMYLEQFQTFKIETKRSNKDFPIPSLEFSRMLGGVVLKNIEGISVDVHHPDVTCFVEIRRDFTYIYTKPMKGIGGYPVGTQPRGMLMLSGGIDSPVAGYLAMKRGILLDAVYFEAIPHTSLEAREKVITLCQKLAKYTSKIRLHIVPFTELQEAIYKNCESSYCITIMRRMMYRIMERLAKKNHAFAIINGESIGQVASQTLTSMKVINEVTCYPVIRPVCCLDKLEIIDLARKIETYETSILPYEDCCTIFVPKHPVINPNLEAAKKMEESFDYQSMIETLLKNIKTISVTDVKKETFQDLL